MQTLFVVGFILVFVVGGILRAMLGRLPAAGLIGGGVGVIAWLLVASAGCRGWWSGIIAFVFTPVRRQPGMGASGWRLGRWRRLAAAAVGGGRWRWRLQRRWGRLRWRRRVGAVVAMRSGRILRHLFTTAWSVRARVSRRTCSTRSSARSARAKRRTPDRSASRSSTALDLPELLRGVSARERAVDVFSMLRVWDTEHNNGVLIYLLLADRDVEIVADRGIHARVGNEGWEAICRSMEAAFRRGDFEGGVVERHPRCRRAPAATLSRRRRRQAQRAARPAVRCSRTKCSECWTDRDGSRRPAAFACVLAMEPSHLQQLIEQYGYLAVLVGALLEGETILLIAGFAAHRGYLDLGAVIAVAAVGGFLGDQVFFWLGRLRGSSVLARWPKLQAHSATGECAARAASHLDHRRHPLHVRAARRRSGPDRHERGGRAALRGVQSDRCDPVGGADRRRRLSVRPGARAGARRYQALRGARARLALVAVGIVVVGVPAVAEAAGKQLRADAHSQRSSARYASPISSRQS